MLGKNRDHLGIVTSILVLASPGATKTKIMVKANLSFTLLEKYLDSVVSAGLLRLEGSRYFLTDNGREFLKQYKDYQEHYCEVEKSLKSLSFEHDKLLHLCKTPKITRPLAAA